MTGYPLRMGIYTWKAEMMLRGCLVRHLRETAFLHLGTPGPHRRMERGRRNPAHTDGKARLSLTQLGVAETEHAAVGSVDHGLDHLRHGPGAHLRLADTRGDTR